MVFTLSFSSWKFQPGHTCIMLKLFLLLIKYKMMYFNIIFLYYCIPYDTFNYSYSS